MDAGSYTIMMKNQKSSRARVIEEDGQIFSKC